MCKVCSLIGVTKSVEEVGSRCHVSRYQATPRVSCLASRLLSVTQRCSSSQFDPPYLDVTVAEIPEYPLLNVQMKSQDFTVLEHYSKWVHKTALNMGIEVEDAWATPSEKFRIQTYKPQSTHLESEYKVQIYERTIQATDLSSILAPLFMEVIQHGLPDCVELTVQEHLPEHSEVRYIPDLELKELRAQLHDLGGPSKSKN
ncbi:large ribosomal subunit protein mL48 isoform X3 [Macrobrachium rosenbergii]|uniref:large ribosomal subunit protein mL48 isoform X3 n=1 Tax=Macrobrachium rosenbergii TaxID=79674 RepID=UPI0034D40AAC